MGKATDDKENESRGFEDVALTLSSSRSRRSVGNTYVRFHRHEATLRLRKPLLLKWSRNHFFFVL